MAQIVTKFIANNSVTNAKLASVPANSYLGNNTGSSANASYITSTQLTANLNTFTALLQGLAPASGGGTANFLRADGTWATPGGTGVTSVTFTGDGTVLRSTPSTAVTTTGTLTATLNTQTANFVLAGPTSAGPSAPTFRALVASDIPSLSATYVLQSAVGAASGVASLDVSGKVPTSQLPSVVMEYQGSWNPNTNSPALSDSTGTNGYVYWVSAAKSGAVSGNTDPSMVNFQIGDLVLYSSSVGKWQLTTPAAGVSSVNGAQGAVTVNAINQLTGDVTAGPASGSASAASSLVATSNATLTTLSALTTASSLASVGTITSGTWSAGTIAINKGGTGQTTAAAAYNALSPMTTTGDIEYEVSAGTAARLGIGSSGQVLTVVSGAPAWQSITAGASTVGTFNSQTSSSNGLVISGANLYAQAATTTNPGMVSIPASGGLALSTAALSINADNSTTKISGSNALEALQPNEEKFTLSPTNITNQYVDLAYVIFGSSSSSNSAGVYVIGGPEQQKGVDYTVSLTGGVGGKTRITFAGDLGTGGNAQLVSGDVLVVDYSYLA
jgi:hypothetical protein